MIINEYENIEGTWSSELKKHFDAFSNACWISFNAACEDMRLHGHENKVDKFKWREYVLWDMQQKHDREKNEN